MSRDMKKLIVVSALLVATAGFAQTTGPVVVTGPTMNQNETVCRTVAETGSRLSRSRVCRTRAQWEQQRREKREDVERGQLKQVNPVG